MTKTVTLGEICSKILSGGTPSTEKPEYWNGDIPWITSADIQDHFTINPRKYITEKAGADVLPAGNILVVTRVGLGKVAVNATNLAFSQDLQGLILKPTVDKRYLVYALSKKVLRFKEISRGATIKGVTREDLVNIQIPLPALPEQRRIAALLDHADALRQKDRQLLTHYDQLAQSVFLELFGDPVRNEKGFREVTLEDITTQIKDGPHVSPEYAESGIPILSTRNIRPNELLLDDIKHVTQRTYDVLTKMFKPQKGDVLLTKGGTTGYAKAVDFDFTFCVWVHLAVLRPTRDVHYKYLEATLNSDFCYEQSQRYTHGIANRDLGLKRIAKIKTLLPPLSLQTHFAQLIGQIEKQKAVVRQQMAASAGLFGRLLQESFG